MDRRCDCHSTLTRVWNGCHLCLTLGTSHLHLNVRVAKSGNRTKLRSHDRPIIIVTDGHRAHRAKKVMAFMESEPRLLDIQILPAYSPELNPAELVWSLLKFGVIGRMLLRSKTQFFNTIRSVMRSIQRKRKTVLSFFRAEHTAYVCIEKFSMQV